MNSSRVPHRAVVNPGSSPGYTMGKSYLIKPTPDTMIINFLAHKADSGVDMSLEYSSKCVFVLDWGWERRLNTQQEQKQHQMLRLAVSSDQVTRKWQETHPQHHNCPWRCELLFLVEVRTQFSDKWCPVMNAVTHSTALLGSPTCELLNTGHGESALFFR